MNCTLHIIKWMDIINHQTHSKRGICTCTSNDLLRCSYKIWQQTIFCFCFAYLFWHVLTPINELERTLIQVEKFIREPSQANNVTGPGRVGPRRSVPGPGRWPPPVPFNSDPGIRAKVATLAILADSILVDALWQLARLLTTFIILPYFIQKIPNAPALFTEFVEKGKKSKWRELLLRRPLSNKLLHSLRISSKFDEYIYFISCDLRWIILLWLSAGYDQRK